MNHRIEVTSSDRRGERGAALVTTMLCATVLLGLGLALIVSTSQENTNTVQMTSEAQAYYAAEAGLESAMAVVRGNVQPLSGMASGTIMNLQNAVTVSTSNLPSDAANSSNPRLSGWLNYNGNTVSLSSSPSLSYSIAISDPDNVGAGNPNGINPGSMPKRIIVQSTGYGPNGTTKKMQMMVTRYRFDMNFPATVTIPGDNIGAWLFQPGDSTPHVYSGADNCSAPCVTTDPSYGLRPAFATSGDNSDLNAISNGNGSPTSGINCNGCKPDTVQPQLGGNPEIGVLCSTCSASASGVSSDDVGTPSFLQSPTTAIAGINALRTAAQAMGGSHYTTSSSASFPGTDASPYFMFVDGDYSLSGTGNAGFLIVTGTLTLNGGFGFDGVILVVGTGSVIRSGGGGGSILGAMVVANTNDANLSTGTFGSPHWDTSGGGNSTIQYDSTLVRKALGATGPVATAVSEY